MSPTAKWPTLERNGHGTVHSVNDLVEFCRSLVAFGPKQRQMGHSAKNQQVLNYKNTIYGFRDLLGRKFSDPYVQQEKQYLPFSIVLQENDTIGIKV